MAEPGTAKANANSAPAPASDQNGEKKLDLNLYCSDCNLHFSDKAKLKRHKDKFCIGSKCVFPSLRNRNPRVAISISIAIALPIPIPIPNAVAIAISILIDCFVQWFKLVVVVNFDLSLCVGFIPFICAAFPVHLSVLQFLLHFVKSSMFRQFRSIYSPLCVGFLSFTSAVHVLFLHRISGANANATASSNAKLCDRLTHTCSILNWNGTIPTSVFQRLRSVSLTLCLSFLCCGGGQRFLTP